MPECQSPLVPQRVLRGDEKSMCSVEICSSKRRGRQGHGPQARAYGFTVLRAGQALRQYGKVRRRSSSSTTRMGVSRCARRLSRQQAQAGGAFCAVTTGAVPSDSVAFSTRPSFAARCVRRKGSMRCLSSSCFCTRPACRFAISSAALILRDVAWRGVAWRGVAWRGRGERPGCRASRSLLDSTN